MKLEIKEVVDQFYEEIKAEFPSLTKEQVREIIYAPFITLKRVIQGDVLSVVRFQYLGTFYVSLKKINYLERKNERDYNNGDIPQKKYLERKKMYEDYRNRKEISEDNLG